MCGACREICPIRIDIPRMLLKLREQGTEAGKSPAWLKLGLRLFRLAATRPELYHLGGCLSNWGTWLMGRGGWIKKLPSPLSGWTKQRDFPVFAKKSFSQRWQEERGRKKS
jgi:L-lactate dehydrogenase complex protein LldF